MMQVRSLSMLTLLLCSAKLIHANEVSRYMQENVINVCANAKLFPLGSVVYVNFTLTTFDATEVPSNCFGTFRPRYPGVWYSFNGTGSVLVARSCDDVTYQYIDYSYPYLSIYRGSCGTGNLQCVASTSIKCGRERFFFNTTLGKTYFVLFQPYEETRSYPGSKPVDLSIFVPPPVENDVCATAKPFVLGSTVSVDTTYARSDALEVPSNCFDTRPQSDPGVWYSVVGTGGPLVARSCPQCNSCFSNQMYPPMPYFGPEPYISIYKGNCGAGNLQCVASTSYTCGRERFFFDTTLGTKYYVLFQSGQAYFDSRLVNLSIFVPTPVENDVCTNAKSFVLGTTVSVDTTYARSDALEVPSNCFDTRRPPSPGVWYSVIGTGGLLVARSCFANYTSISIYKGRCGATNLQCVAGAYYTCKRERLFFNTNRFTTYYVLLQSSDDRVVDLSIFVPPPVENDVCADAKPFVLGSTVYVDTTYARSDELEVPSNCYNTDPPSPGVWYSFVGTGGPLVAGSCFVNDTSISIYKGSCGATNLQCVAGAYFGAYYTCDRERFFFNTTLGTTYYVLLQSYYDRVVDLSIFVPPPVENDVCANAKPISLDSIVYVNTSYARSDALEVPSSCYSTNRPSDPGVWYRFVGTGGFVVARSCFVDTRTSISIYKGSCGAANLQCVAGAYYSCEPERLFFNTTLGTTYYVLIQTYYGSVVDLSIFAASPSENDVCANAKPFVLGSTVYVNTTYARSDALEVPSNCYDTNKPRSPGVWYSVIGTGGLLVARSCSVNYTSISIFKESCGAANLQCVAGTVSTCARERFFFNTTLGTTYYVLLQSAYDSVVDLSIFAASPVENDVCANAKPISLDSIVYVNTTYARSDAVEVPSNCYISYKPREPGVWYSFVGTGGPLVARSCFVDTRTSISIYRGRCGAANLQCVAGTDSTCDLERFFFNTTLGTTYYVLLQSYYGSVVDMSIFAASPVENDVCANAKPIALGSTVSIDHTYATSDELDVRDTCSGLAPPVNPGIWYSFNGTGRNVSVDTCSSAATVVVSVYVGNCGSFLTCVAVGNRLCDGNVLSVITESNRRYLVLVQALTEGPSALFLYEPNLNPVPTPSEPAPQPSPQPVSQPAPATQPVTPPAPQPAPQPVLVPQLFPQPSPQPVLQPAPQPFPLPVPLLPVPPPAPQPVPQLSPQPSPQPVPLPAPPPAPQPVPQLSPQPSPQPVPLPAPRPAPQPGRPPVRPIGRPKLFIAWIFGDPHITTLDGLEYDCQALGEFTLLKSLDSTFHVQSRFTKVQASSSSNDNSLASVTSGIAIRESDEAPLIQVSLLPESSANTVDGCFDYVKLYENGIERPLSSGASSSLVTVSVANDEIILVFTGSFVEVHLYVKASETFGCFLTHWIYLPENYRPEERFLGLLGNANGDPEDDWITKEGGILPTPNSNETMFQRGYDYCREEWCVGSVSDSLFTYGEDESFELYFDCDQEYVSGLEDAVENASAELKNLCVENVQCIIDGVVGSTSDAQTVLNDIARIEEEVENRRPPCGLFERSIFCPLTFQGIFGRLIRRIFGGL